jgi:hypothetical protein
MTDENAGNIADQTRKRGKPFAPGNPGGGRRHGSRNKATRVLDAMAESEAREILKKAIELAKAGDMRAIDILLARIWAPRKGRPVTFTLPPIATAQDVLAGLQAVIEATGRGELTPDEASVVAGLIETKRKALETVELEQRLAKLEEAHELQTKGSKR